MVVRIALMFVAALFLCLGAVFLGIGLYHALLLAFAPWAAALLTGVAAFAVAGLFALVGSHCSRSSGAYGGAALGAASASISRAVEGSPVVAIGAAALVGLLQALIFGRRR